MDTASPSPASGRSPDDRDDVDAPTSSTGPAAGEGAPEGAVPATEAPAPVQQPARLSEMLRRSAQGDQASFAAFYNATADVIYGLAILMHDDADGAQSSTVAVFQQLWDQAGERARDLRLQTQTSRELAGEHEAEAVQEREYETVLEWLVPLAHRIMVERFREGTSSPISLVALPPAEGGGIAGLPEEIIDDLMPLSDSQSQAIALSYLAGGTHQQLGTALESSIPAVKSRLRDGLTRLHQRARGSTPETDPILRAAVTERDVQRGTGVNRNFTDEIAEDLRKGLLVELAEVYALDAVGDHDRALLDEAALTADTDTAQQWDLRVLAARRTLAEIFTAHSTVPPRYLLEEVLHTLHGQEVGMGMVEEFSEHTEETIKREPLMKRWMIIAGLVVVLLVAGLLIWRFTIGQDVQAIADDDPEAETVDGIELAEGGTARAVISLEENVGYVDFADVGALEDAMTYQLWLLPSDQTPPSSLGNFSPDELEDDVVSLRNLDRYGTFLITAEEIEGGERPTGETIMELPVTERITDGPQYGGSSDSEDE